MKKKNCILQLFFQHLSHAFFSSSSFHVIGLLICFQTLRHLSLSKLLFIFDNLQTLDQMRK